MKKSTSLFIFLGIFALLGYCLVVDETLDEDVAQVITQYNQVHQLEKNGSIYQLGLWSALNDSPYEIGLWRLKQYQSALKANNGKVENIDFQDYPAEKNITELFASTNKPNLLCSISEYECLNYIHHKTHEIGPILATAQPYINRYDELMAFSTFTLYEKPSFALPVPSFGPSNDILQLKILAIFEQIQQDQHTSALNELVSLINFQKTILAQTPYMAPKIASIIELEMLINASAFLIAKTPVSTLPHFQKVFDNLKALSKEQLSMKKPFLHEFVAQANTLESMAIKTQDFSDELPMQFQWLPLNVLYKKNKTINKLYQAMTSNLGLLSFNKKQIIKKSAPAIDDLIKFDYQNPIGSMLISSLIPKLLNLEAFIYQIEVKQQMVKYLFQQKSTGQTLAPETFISPFTGKKSYLVGNEFCLSVDEKIENDLCLAAF